MGMIAFNDDHCKSNAGVSKSGATNVAKQLCQFWMDIVQSPCLQKHLSHPVGPGDEHESWEDVDMCIPRGEVPKNWRQTSMLCIYPYHRHKLQY